VLQPIIVGFAFLLPEGLYFIAVAVDPVDRFLLKMSGTLAIASVLLPA
jgi:hypothetical protein